MRPLRRTKKRDVTLDPFTGDECVLDATYETDGYGRQGSIDSSVKHVRVFRDCGCDGPVGGRCFVCGAISCTRCHRHCFACGRSICRQHTSFIDDDGESQTQICHKCDTLLVRRDRIRKLARALLSPFVRFED